MAYYALLNPQNIVTKVIYGDDETGDINWELRFQREYDQVCKRTSYNTRSGAHSEGGTPFRKNFAGVGYTYDESRDAFIPPKPYDSWILDEASCTWKAPVDNSDGDSRYWNEDNQQWDLIS
jgi:hypothetical protein